MARQDALAREWRRSLRIGIALALALHGLAALALAWVARRPAEIEPPPIPVELLVAPTPSAAPSPPIPSAPAPRSRAPTPKPAARAAAEPRERRVPQAPRPAANPAPAPTAALLDGAPVEPSATPPDPNHVFGEGEVDAVATPLGRVEPRYPSRMQLLGREGTVVLDVVVGTDGAVQSASVRTSAGRDFDDATQHAVAQQRFAPALREGRAVRSRVTYRYTFTLE